jgi:hypothetical protein
MEQVESPPDAVILVSSVPALTPEDEAVLKSRQTRLVFAADSMDVRGVEELLDAGLLSLAFLPRGVLAHSGSPADPDSSRAWFDLYYSTFRQ